MKQIKQKREALGITQKEMADKLDVDRSTIGKWELAGSFPRPKYLPQIAELLGCSIDDLYDKPQTDSA